MTTNNNNNNNNYNNNNFHQPSQPTIFSFINQKNKSLFGPESTETENTDDGTTTTTTARSSRRPKSRERGAGGEGGGGSHMFEIREQSIDMRRYNPRTFDRPRAAKFFVIKSYSSVDVCRSIKYNIWCSTEHGNRRLDEAYVQAQAQNQPVYLFFSVNASGFFLRRRSDGLAGRFPSQNSSMVPGQVEWLFPDQMDIRERRAERCVAHDQAREQRHEIRDELARHPRGALRQGHAHAQHIPHVRSQVDHTRSERELWRIESTTRTTATTTTKTSTTATTTTTTGTTGTTTTRRREARTKKRTQSFAQRRAESSFTE